jgi:hypothetical protein
MPENSIEACATSVHLVPVLRCFEPTKESINMYQHSALCAIFECTTAYFTDFQPTEQPPKR